jgi:hypothetical protein
MEVKAIAMVCYLSFFLENSTFPEIRFKGKEFSNTLNKLTESSLGNWFLTKINMLSQFHD